MLAAVVRSLAHGQIAVPVVPAEGEAKVVIRPPDQRFYVYRGRPRSAVVDHLHGKRAGDTARVGR